MKRPYWGSLTAEGQAFALASPFNLFFPFPRFATYTPLQNTSNGRTNDLIRPSIGSRNRMRSVNYGRGRPHRSVERDIDSIDTVAAQLPNVFFFSTFDNKDFGNTLAF